MTGRRPALLGLLVALLVALGSAPSAVTADTRDPAMLLIERGRRPLDSRLPPSSPLNGGFLLLNMHGLLFHELDGDIRENVAYARWLGAGVIRVFATDSSTRNGWSGTRVGNRIAEIAPILRASNVKLIVALVNNHSPVPNERPGSSGWLDNYWQLLLPFYTDTWRGPYLDYIRGLIGSVRSREALDVIQAWELGNEMHTPENPPAIMGFVTGAVQEVRAIDPLTPILPGTMGANHIEPWNPRSPIARWLYCDAPVDAYTLHAYDWVSPDRPGDMPINWDLDSITAQPCPSGRRLPVLVEELGTSRSLAGAYNAEDEEMRLEHELRQIEWALRYPQVIGIGMWESESPRVRDRTFFDIRRGLTSYGTRATGGGSCYDPSPDPVPGTRCRLEMVLRDLSFARAAPVTANWVPGRDTQSEAVVLGSIETPTTSTRLLRDDGLVVSGWAVDLAAAAGTGAGLTGLELYLGTPDTGGSVLSSGLVGLARPDVAQALERPEVSDAGFEVRLARDQLPVGTSTLTVALHTRDRGTWWSALQVTVPPPLEPVPDLLAVAAPPVTASVAVPLPVAAGAPKLVVSSPPTGASVSRGQLVEGLASDGRATAASDSGIARVDVFLEPGRDRGGQFLGSYVKARRATSSGATTADPRAFSIPVQIPPGRHTLHVYAQSSLDGREATLEIPVAAQ